MFKSVLPSLSSEPFCCLLGRFFLSFLFELINISMYAQLIYIHNINKWNGNTLRINLQYSEASLLRALILSVFFNKYPQYPVLVTWTNKIWTRWSEYSTNTVRLFHEIVRIGSRKPWANRNDSWIFLVV